MGIGNINLIRAILNLYSEKVNAPIAFACNDEIVWQCSKQFCSPYCRELNKFLPEKCLADHLRRAQLKEEKLTLCYAGLWNYVVPIKREGKIVGTLLTGQRRLQNKDQESLENLLAIKDKFTNEQFDLIKKAFYETPMITSFDINLLHSLKFVEEQLYEVVIVNELEKQKIINLAHEFLLPIQSIVANAENIYFEANNEGGELAEQAEEILRQVIRLGKISENMRSSLMGVRHDKYSYINYDIYTVIEENVKIFKNEALKKNVSFDIDMQTAMIPMSYDHLSRAMFNLIHNAIKYSYFSLDDHDRYIKIYGRRRRAKYLLEIINFGIGILEEEKQKVFQDGYRGLLSGDRERTGSGIGLSEAKRIIENHKGTITIDSILLGKNKFHGPYKTSVTVKLLR